MPLSVSPAAVGVGPVHGSPEVVLDITGAGPVFVVVVDRVVHTLGQG